MQNIDLFFSKFVLHQSAHQKCKIDTADVHKPLTFSPSLPAPGTNSEVRAVIRSGHHVRGSRAMMIVPSGTPPIKRCSTISGTAEILS
jgi:hypothetical protein